MSLLSEQELTVRAVCVRAEDLVLIRHHLEASEGLGFLIAKSGGDALLVAPISLADDLDRFIEDMKEEFQLSTVPLSVHQKAFDVAL